MPTYKNFIANALSNFPILMKSSSAVASVTEKINGIGRVTEIYSYRTLIAKVLILNDGRRIGWFTPERYSVTTSKHLNCVKANAFLDKEASFVADMDNMIADVKTDFEMNANDVSDAYLRRIGFRERL